MGVGVGVNVLIVTRSCRPDTYASASNKPINEGINYSQTQIVYITHLILATRIDPMWSSSGQ